MNEYNETETWVELIREDFEEVGSALCKAFEHGFVYEGEVYMDIKAEGTEVIAHNSNPSFRVITNSGIEEEVLKALSGYLDKAIFVEEFMIDKGMIISKIFAKIYKVDKNDVIKKTYSRHFENGENIIGWHKVCRKSLERWKDDHINAYYNIN